MMELQKPLGVGKLNKIMTNLIGMCSLIGCKKPITEEYLEVRSVIIPEGLHYV